MLKPGGSKGPCRKIQSEKIEINQAFGCFAVFYCNISSLSSGGSQLRLNCSGARFWFVLVFFETRPLRVEHISLHVKIYYIYIYENIIITMIIIYYNDYEWLYLKICIYILHL